ncbi:MAG: sensor histidine kinase [bacterium]
MKLNITQKLMVGFLVVLLCGTMSGAISYVSLDQIETQLQTFYTTREKDGDRRMESIIKELKHMKVLTFALIMLDFLVTVIVILILSNKFTDPIISLSTMAKEIGEGQWGKIIDISSQDEIGQLAGTFNQMSRSILDREKQIEKAQEELKKRDEILVKTNSELERLNELKSDFLSTVSHELKTPLTAIKGYVSLIKNSKIGPINQQQYKCLVIADERVDHLNNLISDLLDLSKIEANRYEIKSKKDDLARLIRNTVSSLSPIFKNKKLNLEVRIPQGLSPVHMDAPKINQVLTNLLGNAVKFTPSGGDIKVSVTQDVSQNGGSGSGFVQVDISDTGIGLAPDQREKIFEKFYQVDHSPTREYDGTGLGLPIAKEIVELHGGMIWVKKMKGKGSTFSFTIPMAVEAGAVESEKTAETKKSRPTTRKKREKKV